MGHKKSLRKSIQVPLQAVCQSANMNPVYKRVVYLYRKGKQDLLLFFILFPPVKQGQRLILISRLCMGNMGVGHPGKSRKLKYIIF